MKVTSYAVGRPSYYDRQSSSLVNSYSAILSPHSLTARFTQTVPALQKYMVEFANGYNSRVTVAATASGGGVTITVAGVALINIYGTLTTAGSNASQQQAVNMIIVEGASIIGSTQDGSTGGTLFYDINCKSTVFTA